MVTGGLVVLVNRGMTIVDDWDRPIHVLVKGLSRLASQRHIAKRGWSHRVVGRARSARGRGEWG